VDDFTDGPGVDPHGWALLLVGLAALTVLIAFVVPQEREPLARDFLQISLAVAVLSAIILLIGWVAGRLGALGARDTLALIMSLAVRNVSIATAVAVTLLGQTEFAVFAAVYFLNQVPILVAVLVLFRLTYAAGAEAPG
jgi:BASS family bile acid:Na+ symporter